jgi:hypothetical protein
MEVKEVNEISDFALNFYYYTKNAPDTKVGRKANGQWPMANG